MKAGADRGLRFHFVAVGVASEDESFINDDEFREYLQRNIVAVRLPRMDASELSDIVTKRRELFSIDVEDEVLRDLDWVARGYPAHLHQIALEAALTWIQRNSSAISAYLGGREGVLGRLLRRFGSRPAATTELDVSISRDEFDKALTQFARVYATINPDTAKAYSISSADECKAIIDHYATSDSDVVPLAGIARSMRLDEVGVSRLVGAACSALLEEEPVGSLRATKPGLRPYLRACLLLEHADR
jgi:hypothetical protein